MIFSRYVGYSLLLSTIVALPASESQPLFNGFQRTLPQSAGLRNSTLGTTSTAEPYHVPGSYIIQFQNVAQMKKRALDGDHHREFVSGLRQSLGVNASIRAAFDSGVFEGVSIRIQRRDKESMDPEEEMDIIRSLPDVKSVSFDRRVTLADKDKILAVGADAVKMRPLWSTHTKTRVAELHEMGIKGKGVRVCVIDDGIDGTHPAFAGRFIGGLDYTRGMDEPKRTDVSQCPGNGGHGTHVAGILAGKDDKLTGVAPEAEIFVYKVFECTNTGTDSSAWDSAILMALSHAPKDKCNVINMSIGYYGNAKYAVDDAIENLKEQGIIVIVAAGNEGDHGPFYMNGYADPGSTIAVGSTVHDQDLLYTAIATDTGGKKIEIPVEQVVGSGFVRTNVQGQNTALEIVYIPNPCQKNKGPNPKLLDLKNKVALIPWGRCKETIVAIEVMSQGGRDILFYIDSHNGAADPSTDGPNLVNSNINWGVIRRSDAIKLLEMQTPMIAFGGSKLEGHNTRWKGAGYLSTSSTWGPTNDGRLKPEISAPGGKIFSAWPQKLGHYAVVSGTSMAAPYVAGVAALAYSAEPNLKKDAKYVEVLRQRIIGSGQFVNWFDGRRVSKSLFAPVAQQGNGAINAFSTLYPAAKLWPPVFHLYDDLEEQFLTLSIENPTRKDLEYTITHIPAATCDTFAHAFVFAGQKDDLIPRFPPNIEKPVATVGFSVDSFELGPKQSKNIKIRIQPPRGVSAHQLPIYGGKFVVTSSGIDNPAVSVPYIGFASSLRDSVNPINTRTVKFTNVAKNRQLSSGDRLEKVDPDSNHLKELIRVEFTVAFWSNKIKILLESVPKTKTDPIDRFDLIRSPNWKIKKQRDSPADEKNVRADRPNRFAWRGMLETKEVVPTVGTYRLLIRALKPLGNELINADWQEVRSANFKIIDSTVKKEEQQKQSPVLGSKIEEMKQQPDQSGLDLNGPDTSL